MVVKIRGDLLGQHDANAIHLTIHTVTEAMGADDYRPGCAVLVPLDQLALPLITRSIAVCRRLLDAQGSPRLGRVVLVGGPTNMPLLRAAVREALGAPFGEGLDPMTLVAQGAALYAGTTGLDARPKAAEPPGARFAGHDHKTQGQQHAATDALYYPKYDELQDS